MDRDRVHDAIHALQQQQRMARAIAMLQQPVQQGPDGAYSITTVQQRQED